MKNDISGKSTIYYNDKIISKNISDFDLINEKINDKAIYDFLLYGSILPPNSIYKNIKTLFPGEDFNEGLVNNLEYKKLAQTKIINKKLDYFVDELDRMLQKYFNKKIKNSKNLAIFLSGGVDSGLLASYLPKETICVSWGGWGKKSTDLKFAEKTFQKFNFKKQIKVLFNYEEDKKLYKKIIQKTNIPFPLSAIAYARMSKELSSEFNSEDVLCFSGQNADTITNAFDPTRITFFLSKINNFSPRFLFKKLKNYKRKMLLLSTNNPLKLIAFFHSNGIFPGKWINVDKKYFKEKKHQVENQLGKKIKKINDFILMDQLMTEARRNQINQNFIPSLYSIQTALPFYEKEIIELFLSVPYKIRKKEKFGKIILKKLAEKRGVPIEIINKPKKGLSYGYKDYINSKKHLKIWEEMEQNNFLNNFVNIKLIRKKHQNNFATFDILRSLHYFIKYNLKLK